MNEAFEKLNIAKRDKIINCAFEEFSKYKFDKASTNNIVKNAGISKGILFYYFNNKEDLFKYLSQFCVDTILEEIRDHIDWNESDIFERIKQAVFFKIKITERFPYIFFFGKLLYDDEKKEGLLNNNKEAMDLLSKIYTYNIDYTKFKKSIDINKAVKVIMWTLEKYGEEASSEFDNVDININYDVFLEETNSYIDILKTAFYKE